ncbi:ABC transporter ATP-binding protein [Roseobacter sp. HKCC-CH-9208]|uniref:ABC transporter ATP-binding protein n=1 Tax=Roseobacter sp. HKCC-CH-9208 TaxID=3120339 RepID=UPI0030EBD3AF
MKPSEITEKRSWRLVVRLWREHVIGYWPILLFALILMSLEGAALGAFAWMVRPLFDELFQAQSLDGLWRVVAIIGGLFSFRAVAGFVQRLIMSALGLKVTTAIQTRLVRHLLTLDGDVYTRHPVGELIERVRGDSTTLQTAATSLLLSLGKDAVSLVALSFVMFSNDWQWSLVALVGLPLIFLPMTLLLKLIRRTAFAAREAAAGLTTRLDEMFHGIQSIKVNRLEHHETSRFERGIKQYLRQQIRSNAGQSANPSLIDLVSGIGFVSVTLFGATAIVTGEKSVGDFMSFITALSLMFDPLKRLSNLAGSLQSAAASLERIYGMLDQKPTVLSPAHPKPIAPGDIVFDRVEFSYGDLQIIKEFSFTAKKGQTTAIVGPSGAGKTTLFALLTRLIDPVSGSVSIGDVKTTDAGLSDLRDMIAVVGQETALFDDTIEDNIRLGRLNATPDEIKQAAEDASVMEFVRQLPDGLKSAVGPRGSSLSGGQRQRVAIARAMVKNAPILLLDEPTSALDTHSEKLVQSALDRLSQGRTTLVIAHRLSTVRHADKIVVMDRGKVVEEGNHDTLIEKGGVYAGLFQLQLMTGTLV